MKWRNPDSIETITLNTNFTCENTIVGDFNNDNLVNNNDLVILSRYIYDNTIKIGQSGDLNNDLKVNAIDIILLLELISLSN